MKRWCSQKDVDYCMEKKSRGIRGIDINTNTCFAELVEDRKSETNKELITKRVHPKTCIITEGGPIYV